MGVAPEAEIVGAMAQFGVAGLIAWMWLTERRAAASREADLHRTHERLVEDRRALDAVLRVVQDNTRALVAVESGVRELSHAMGRREADGVGRGGVRPAGGGG